MTSIGHQPLLTTPNTDIVSSLVKPKKQKQNKPKWQVDLIQGKFKKKHCNLCALHHWPFHFISTSNKNATVKSLTSKRLSDFVDDSSNSIRDPLTYHNEGSSSNIAGSSKTTFEKYSLSILHQLYSARMRSWTKHHCYLLVRRPLFIHAKSSRHYRKLQSIQRSQFNFRQRCWRSV